jgi:uncharacterized protein YndB with AHSA1/START domain
MEPSSLHIERTFNAPREKVWEAISTPEGIKKWWGPKMFSCPTAEIDLRVGGKYLFCMRGAMGPGMPEQDFWSGGEYTEIVPMEKVVMTDHFATKEGNYINAREIGMPGEWPDEMMITMELSDDNGGTKLSITNDGHPAEMTDPATSGWNEQLDKLAAVLG